MKGTEEGGGEKEAQDCPVHERPSAGTMVVKTQKLVIRLITSTTSHLYTRKATTGSTIKDWISEVRQESSKQKGRQCWLLKNGRREKMTTVPNDLMKQVAKQLDIALMEAGAAGRYWRDSHGGQTP